ncbi:iron uptake system protein EfeO [Pseudokineococcus basanitobsidens]|uniref:Iron uptake system protein EfeO n=1 Tax=Pseudokineococcus basanitobsidens TaxID=1926649 RepID=A0ABU8RHI0_9ACTN
MRRPAPLRRPGTPPVPPLVALGLLALPLTACATDAAPASGSGTADGEGPVVVTAADDACEASRSELTAGISTFAITNAGGQVTEVYVYDGDRIVTEKEDIGPGTSYDLTVDLGEGTYQLACKPGMVGEGIRTDLVVSPAAVTQADDPAAVRAVADYRAFVQEQADSAVPLVTQLAAAVEAGDVEAARALYAPSRAPWERVEPVAEAFGDLDPRMDAREADLAPGDDFTGWHRLEKALWTGEDLAPLVPVADQLVDDVAELAGRVPEAPLTPTSIGNGAKELLDEVATGKITGEEEAFSHTDLVDVDANVTGAQEALEALRPLVQEDDPALVAELDARFADLRTALEPYRDGDGWVSYDTLDEDQRLDLSRAVDALAEPLSGLAAAASR